MNWQKYEFQTVYQPAGKTKENYKKYIFGPDLVKDNYLRQFYARNKKP